MTIKEQEINSTDQEKATELAKYIKRAAEMTHTVTVAVSKTKKAASAIQSQDKETKWQILQEYLKEYGPFINETTFITGIHVYPVDQAFYDSISIQEINQRLQILIGIVYLKDATHAARKAIFTACLKKLIKPTGLLSEAQLNLL